MGQGTDMQWYVLRVAANKEVQVKEIKVKEAEGKQSKYAQEEGNHQLEPS